MSFLPEPLRPERAALLTRVAPVTRLVVGAAWLLAAVMTVDPVVPARLMAAGVVVLILGSGIPLAPAVRRLSPLLLAAAGIAVLTALLHPANADRHLPAAVDAAVVRITPPALSAALALALRLGAIALTSLLVFAPSDPTRFADSLVQQWRLPERFAYGTAAALRVAPLLAADWAAISAARRLRGLQPRGLTGRARESGDRLLVLLVSALRRAERMAISMDARGFDSGRPRSRYRPVRLGTLDAVVLIGGIGFAAIALLFGR